MSKSKFFLNKCTKTFWSHLNSPTLRQFFLGSGEIKNFGDKGLDRVFKLPNKFFFEILVHRYNVQKSCKKVFYVFFLKFGQFYPKSGNFSSFVTLKMIILARAINKCFQKSY